MRPALLTRRGRNSRLRTYLQPKQSLYNCCSLTKSRRTKKEKEIIVKKKKSVSMVRNAKTPTSTHTVTEENEIQQTLVNKTELSKPKKNFNDQFYEIEEKHFSNIEDERSEKESSERKLIEKINISDSDEETDVDKSDIFLDIGDEFDIQRSEARDDLLQAIEKCFKLVEAATEGKWIRWSNKLEPDLDDILESLNLTKYESRLFSSIYNLDVNYRQMYIYFLGVDNMLLKHALLCKQKYPNCIDIPENHQEDMKCCMRL